MDSELRQEIIHAGALEAVAHAAIPADAEQEWRMAGGFLKALFGYSGNLSLTEVVAYWGYLVVALWYLARPSLSVFAGRRGPARI